MKRFCIIIVVIAPLFPSLTWAYFPPSSQEQELSAFLTKKYGNDSLQKLEKITWVQEKIEPLKSIKATKLKTLLKTVKQDIILNNLTDYTVQKYIKSGIYEKEDFRSSYEELWQMDTRADIHPFYLENLLDSLRKDPIFDENSTKFRSLVYILFSIKERVRDNPDFEENIRNNFEAAWNDAKKEIGIKIPTSKVPIYARVLEGVAKKEHLNRYSLDDLALMRRTIETEKISPNSFYFKAFLSMRETLAWFKEHFQLPIRFVHSLQARKLSCEANSATDLINFYRTNSHLAAIVESDVINLLPVRPDEMTRVGDALVWWDPNKHFVGNLDGKQSSNLSIFTGYGIYADGIAPTINRFLSSQNLSVRKGVFDEKLILDSLSQGHPIMFWYLSAISENEDGIKKYSTRPITWKTPEGKEIHGYIGEHVGLIVGADFNRSGHITTISYYQGRSESLEKASFTDIQKVASFFNEALYVDKQ